MAKATTTIKQILGYQPDHTAWFAANQALFNQVTSFYFEVIQAHEKVLDLSNQDALTALEKLTHTTQSNPTPVMPLCEIQGDIPALFRRAAINAALGSARSFYSHLYKWHKRKEKFEHLGNLKATKGKYSKRGNDKRAYWMKGRIFNYCKYKAYNAGILTSRVNPRNTSRECARCHNLVARYATGKPAEGYTSGAPLVACAHCGMKGNADRNASLVIGQRLITRYQKFQEKPPTPLLVERGEKSPGVVVSQGAGCQEKPSLSQARHGDTNEHGTAQDRLLRMDEHLSDIPCQLRIPLE